MIARLLCWLGMRQVVITHTGHVMRDNRNRRETAVGFCARCQRRYEWAA